MSFRDDDEDDEDEESKDEESPVKVSTYFTVFAVGASLTFPFCH